MFELKRSGSIANTQIMHTGQCYRSASLLNQDPQWKEHRENQEATKTETSGLGVKAALRAQRTSK